MYLLDDADRLLDSEVSLDLFQGQPCVVLESSGGANQARGVLRRNPDYNKALATILGRLAQANLQITRVVLDSRKVSAIPVENRIVELGTPYPINLAIVDLDELRRTVQRKVSQMHRDPEAEQGGNAQKKIRICIDAPIDADKLISNSGTVTDGAGLEPANGLTDTERSYLRSARIGQGKFRQDLLNKHGRSCPITGIKNEDLLIASHIKPWNACTNAERLDPNNGILLSALVDKLFDSGLITFSDEGHAVVSPSLAAFDQERCRIDHWARLDLSAQERKYMAFHREFEFQLAKVEAGTPQQTEVD